MAGCRVLCCTNSNFNVANFKALHLSGVVWWPSHQAPRHLCFMTCHIPKTIQSIFLTLDFYDIPYIVCIVYNMWNIICMYYLYSLWPNEQIFHWDLLNTEDKVVFHKHMYLSVRCVGSNTYRISYLMIFKCLFKDPIGYLVFTLLVIMMCNCN